MNLSAIPAWIEAHPLLFTVVLWPLISGTVNVVLKRRTIEEYAAMPPRLAAVLMFLRSAGLDPGRSLEHIHRGLTGKPIPVPAPPVPTPPPSPLPVIRDTPTDPTAPIHFEDVPAPPSTKPEL